MACTLRIAIGVGIAAATGSLLLGPPPTAPQTAAAALSIAGLDHIPIAVNDLEQAADDYRALGFALKPGRAHDNGIRNQHVKFPDGTELELITAPAARDPLTTTYRRYLAQGDGPAFLAFFAPSRAAVLERLDSAGIKRREGELLGALDYVFFGPRNASPTDLPEHFAHSNTAESLVSVWLAGADLSAERALLIAMGARITNRQVRVPSVSMADVAQLPEGDVILLPGNHQMLAGRRIVGATVRVRDLEVASSAVQRGTRRDGLVSSGTSLFLPPPVTHGLWLELRHK
ncbi:hypothetical protein BH18ACI5_BH18ACI5_03820 [soil metagenome]